MKTKLFKCNPIEENTYLLYDETKECVVIDAGFFSLEEKNALLDFISENQLRVTHLLNTHLHFDHILGVKFIMNHFNLALEAHQEDEFLLKEMPVFIPKSEVIDKIGVYLKENDVISFGNQKLIVLHIPGHSPGSIVFYNKEAGCVFVGDVLFRDSIGRTDLIGGNHQQLIMGIKEKLLNLPSETIVYSGHGPSTTIGYEMKNNFYLQ